MNPANILIVDDDHDTRKLMQSMLHHAGYAAQGVASGEEALALLENNPDFDVILLDIMLGGVDGLELLRRIKTGPRTAGIKVIMVSALSQVDDKIQAFSGGASDYMAKPFDQGELLARINAQIRLKSSEAALQESEERYRTLAEHAGDMISRFTPAGVYTYVSPAAMTILGYRPDEMEGRSFYDYIHPDDLAEIKGMNPPILNDMGRSIFTLRFRRRDDVYVWLETSAHGVYRYETDSSEIIAVTRDVTERKRYEAALSTARDDLEKRVADRTAELSHYNELLELEIEERQRAEAALQQERTMLAQRVEERTAELSAANAQLARAARLKDEFLASMSHELRTPLNAVLGISEALQENVYGPLTDPQRQAVHSVEESGRHLLDLINDILDLSKIEAGKLHLEMEPMSVENVCQASLRFIKPEAHKKRLKLTASIDPAAAIITADMRRLKQILVNLLSNAVKFTPEDGAVGLQVTADTVQNAIHFSIWDTGIGIPSKKLSTLFQPFVQLDSKLSRRYSGTGLGLALVRRMAEMHGGSVSVESQPGQGSRFTVSLPWKPAEEQEPADESPFPGLPSANLTDLEQILVVEDSAIAAQLITRYLTELGLTVLTHPQGNGVLERALTAPPDAIILDVLLPDCLGWEVLAALKHEPRTRHIPVIVVSVLEEKDLAQSLGADNYLTKPITRHQLQQVLAAIKPPAKTAAAQPSPPVPAQTEPTPPPRILLADDNEVTIKTITDYLRSKGFQIIVARNGLEAISRAKEDRPDLILMDIQMPEVDGLEAIRRIRTSPALVNLPIIAITALAMPGDRERCLAAGANDYLSKPISLKGLVETIETQLRERA
jgi:PAS domain S-box-containing protein